MRQADFVVPSNRQTPIAADLRFDSPAASGDLSASFDWRHAEGECWQIAIETEDGSVLELKDGGTHLVVDGQVQGSSGATEYESLYRTFAELVGARRAHVDLAPLRLTAEAFLLAGRVASEPFVD